MPRSLPKLNALELDLSQSDFEQLQADLEVGRRVFEQQPHLMTCKRKKFDRLIGAIEKKREALLHEARRRKN